MPCGRRESWSSRKERREGSSESNVPRRKNEMFKERCVWKLKITKSLILKMFAMSGMERSGEGRYQLTSLRPTCSNGCLNTTRCREKINIG